MKNNTDIVWVICEHMHTNTQTPAQITKNNAKYREDLRPGNSSSSNCCFCRVPFLSYFNKEKHPCITTEIQNERKSADSQRLLEV